MPRPEKSPTAADPLVDVPFDTGFLNPIDLVELAIGKRTGDQWPRIFGFQQRHYEKWISEGRPKRVFPGLVASEDDVPDQLQRLVDQKAAAKQKSAGDEPRRCR